MSTFECSEVTEGFLPFPIPPQFLDGMLDHCMVQIPSALNSPVPIYTPGQRGVSMKVILSIFYKNNTMNLPRLEPPQLSLDSSVLTIRLEMLFSSEQVNNWLQNQNKDFSLCRLLVANMSDLELIQNLHGFACMYQWLVLYKIFSFSSFTVHFFQLYQDIRQRQSNLDF